MIYFSAYLCAGAVLTTYGMLQPATMDFVNAYFERTRLKMGKDNQHWTANRNCVIVFCLVVGSFFYIPFAVFNALQSSNED